MKKILLLTTGGTITSIPGEEGLAPGMTDKELVGYLPENNQNYQVESINVMNIDSTNMQPESWVRIAKTVYENYGNYDGFVITHGTDTMVYTSAALSYMLQNLDKPVVLTGSQIPIIFEKTDAKKNINDAVRFACEDIGGVYVVFNGKVISGTRAVKVRTKSYNAFMSINTPYIAYIEGSKVNYTGEVSTTGSNGVKLDTALCTEVFLLKLYPGIKPDIFDYVKQSYKGVIIESYGNGGIPFENCNLLPKITELIEAGIAVVLTTQCLEEGTDLSLYEVGRKVAKKLIISTQDMNTEAIVTKLMWVLGKTSNLYEVKQMMEIPMAMEITTKESHNPNIHYKKRNHEIRSYEWGEMKC